MPLLTVGEEVGRFTYTSNTYRYKDCKKKITLFTEQQADKTAYSLQLYGAILYWSVLFFLNVSRRAAKFIEQTED
jgi:hypothetical protein